MTKKFMVDFLEKINQEHLNVLYVQIRKDGEIAEDYKVFEKKTRLNMMSLSKSVVSLACGIALKEGLLSLDEKICDCFPEYVPEHASDCLRQVQVRHLLTMTSGLEKSLFFTDDPERYTVNDWIAYFFQASFVDQPGTKFLYSNFNTYMLCCLIEKRAGQNLLEYLRYRLFEPIGIGNPDWTLCPQGHCYAANGLYLNIDELGNLSELLAGMGTYRGREIVPREYMEQATRKQVDTLERYEGKQINQTYGYGYQFWMTGISDSFLCSGNYGEYCLVLPKKNLAVNVISLEGNHHKRIMDILLETAEQHLAE